MTINASFMYSLKAPLNEWLKLQSQALSICTKAVLVSRIGEARYQLAAQWPTANAALDNITELAITEAIAKERLHLVPVGTDKLVVCQPVVVNGIFWGDVVLTIKCTDKKIMPAVLKKLQGGLTWLQLILQSYAAAPTQLQLQNVQPQKIQQPVSQKESSHDASLLQLLTQLMQENSLRESAITLVNLLATQLQAARVSLGLRQQTMQIEAISFSANFDKRTHPMQIIAQAMDEAVQQGQDIFLFCGDKK